MLKGNIPNLADFLTNSFMDYVGFEHDVSSMDDVLIKKAGVRRSDCTYAGQAFAQGLVSGSATQQAGFYDSGAGNRIQFRALADMYKDAVFAQGEHERRMHLQLLGDSALIQASIFKQRSQNSMMGLSYYQDMGATAFSWLGNKHENPTFLSMAENFIDVSTLCSEVLRNQSKDLGFILDGCQEESEEQASKISDQLPPSLIVH
jgi:hypothetical protein